MTLEGKTFEEIRYQCLREGRLFEDPDFPAVDTSLFHSKAPPRPVVWKRPSELVSDPKLFLEGATRFDVKQGELGNSWLVAAIACLCGNERLLHKVVPHDQDLGRDKNYAGIIHFRFWQHGKWTDVKVDDRLPTDSDGLVFMHSVESNEFWPALLEKAYAKLMGSYEALIGGATGEAMANFTGGVTEMFDLRQPPADLITTMMDAFQKGALMGCSIEAPAGKTEVELSNGLVMGHAYSITAVQKVDIRTGEITLVRVRNPWGNEREWNGPWSDRSSEWRFLPGNKRLELGLTCGDDGEFWMSFQDFSSNFQKLEICNLGPDIWSEVQTSGDKLKVDEGGDPLRNLFEQFSGDDMEINAWELKAYLNANFGTEFDFEGFSTETCRSIVAMVDVDSSGKLGFKMVRTVWNDLNAWKNIFRRFDSDRNGSFNSSELYRALDSVGLKVSSNALRALVARYSDATGKIHFEDFTNCLARLTTMFGIFNGQKHGDTAEFSLDTFIEKTMYS